MIRRTVVTGPFATFFTNVNTAMKLPGHSHHALVTLTWETLAADNPQSLGFPAFADSYAHIQDVLTEALAAPLRNYTNEGVADLLFSIFVGLPDHPPAAVSRWGACRFRLARLDLAVRGVPDKIGHADGFTTYTVEVEADGP